MSHFNLNIEISVSRNVNLTIWSGSTSERLYLAWKESQSDEDWEELVEWLHDDISDEIDFYVTEIEE